VDERGVVVCVKQLQALLPAQTPVPDLEREAFADLSSLPHFLLYGHMPNLSMQKQGYKGKAKDAVLTALVTAVINGLV
jgi:hypothetical protein